MPNINLNTFFTQTYQNIQNADKMYLQLAEAPKTNGDKKTQNTGNDGPKPLEERHIEQIAPDKVNAQKNREMRNELLSAAKAYLKDGGVAENDQNAVLNELRERLGINNPDNKDGSLPVTPLEARRIANYVRSKTGDADRMVVSAVRTTGLPGNVQKALVRTLNAQANHPDVMAFLDTYGSGKRNIDLLARVAALAVRLDDGTLDNHTKHYLIGFSCGLAPTTDASAATVTSLKNNSDLEATKAKSEGENCFIMNKLADIKQQLLSELESKIADLDSEDGKKDHANVLKRFKNSWPGIGNLKNFIKTEIGGLDKDDDLMKALKKPANETRIQEKIAARRQELLKQIEQFKAEVTSGVEKMDKFIAEKKLEDNEKTKAANELYQSFSDGFWKEGPMSDYADKTISAYGKKEDTDVNAGGNVNNGAKIEKKAPDGGWQFSGTKEDGEKLNALFSKLQSNVVNFFQSTNEYRSDLKPQPSKFLAPEKLLEFVRKDDEIERAMFGSQEVDKDIKEHAAQHLVKNFLVNGELTKSIGKDTSEQDVQDFVRKVLIQTINENKEGKGDNPLENTAVERNVMYVKGDIKNILKGMNIEDEVKKIIIDDFTNNLDETKTLFRTMMDDKLKSIAVKLEPDTFKESIVKYADLAKVHVKGAGERVLNTEKGDGYKVCKNHGPNNAGDVSLNTVYGQGSNTCFMMSFVNGMLATKKGENILKNALVTNQQGGTSLKSRGVEGKQERTYADNVGETHTGYSNFERMLFNAYRDIENDVAKIDPSEKQTQPGGQGIAQHVGRVFGYVEDGQEVIHSKDGKKDDRNNGMIHAWEKAAECLSKNGVCVLHSGTKDYGHYIAVTAAYKNNKGRPCFEVRDSWNGSVHEIVLDDLFDKNKHDSSINPGDVTVIAMNPPNDVSGH